MWKLKTTLYFFKRKKLFLWPERTMIEIYVKYSLNKLANFTQTPIVKSVTIVSIHQIAHEFTGSIQTETIDSFSCISPLSLSQIWHSVRKNGYKATTDTCVSQPISYTAVHLIDENVRWDAPFRKIQFVGYNIKSGRNLRHLWRAWHSWGEARNIWPEMLQVNSTSQIHIKGDL